MANQEIDNQIKAINEVGSQFSKALMMSNESLMKSNEATLKTRDMPFIIDKDTANIIHLMGAQSNPQLQLKFKNLDIGEFEMNGVKVTYHDDSFLVRRNICEFLD